MLPSGLADVVSDEEDIARFLTQSSHFNKLMAKPSAFLPGRSDRETSVSRHCGSPIEELWEIGLAAAGARSLYGAALFKVRAIKTAHLEIAADEPPPRHAIIHGWPWMEHDPALQKAQQLEAASVLASQSRLVLRLALSPRSPGKNARFEKLKTLNHLLITRRYMKDSPVQGLHLMEGTEEYWQEQ
jgi:hypothetical protein